MKVKTFRSEKNMTTFIKSTAIYFLGIYCDIYKHSFNRRMDRLIRNGRTIADRRTCFMSDRCLRLSEKFENAAREIELTMQDRRI